MARTGAYTYSEDDPEKLSAGQWASGIGTGAASGASAGSAAGPWGTVVGGIIGAGVGAFATSEQEAQYIEAQRQQMALDKELQDRSYIDGLMTDANIARTARERAVMTESEFAANRLGLTGQGAGMLTEQTRHNLALEDASSKGDLYRMANEMEAQRQGRVMDRYGFQQQMANSAMAGAGDTLQAFGQAAGSIGKLATMKQETPTDAAASTATPDDLMALGGQGGSTYEPGAGLSKETSDRMRMIGYQAKTTDTVRDSMSKLSPSEQVALAEAYPEAFGGTYLFPENVSYERTPTIWSPPTEGAPASGGGAGGAPTSGSERAGKGRSSAATAPAGGTPVATAPRVNVRQNASQGPSYASPLGLGTESRPDILGFSNVNDDLYPTNYSDVSAETGVTPSFQMGVKPETIKAQQEGDYGALLDQAEKKKYKLTPTGEAIVGAVKETYLGQKAQEAYSSITSPTPLGQRVTLTNTMTPSYTISPTARNGGYDKEYQEWFKDIPSYQKPLDEQGAISLYESWLSYYKNEG